MLSPHPKHRRFSVFVIGILFGAVPFSGLSDDDSDFASLVEDYPLTDSHAVAGSDPILDPGMEMVSVGPGSDAHAFSFDSMSDAEMSVYMAKMEHSMLRPGLVDSGASFVPFEASRRLARGFRMRAETGIGYDSNTLLSNGGYNSPTHPDRGRRGGTVSWARFNVGYSSGAERDGRRIFYGFDIGGDLFSYDRGTTRSGRGRVEPSISPYIGIRGAKTTVRLSTFYRFTDGNYLYSYDARREAPVAESQTYGYNLAVTREIGRGRLNYVYSFRRIDFDADTLLNDQDSHIHDLSYLYDHPSMPKTSYGLGFRFGNTDTFANPDTNFYEPSFRVNYAPTAKTTLHGRIGYAFREYDGPGAIGNDGRMTYALGGNWAATERIRLGFTAYRDFNPSFVSAGESFDTDGVALTANYASPWWRLHFQGHVGYERADYYSTFANAVSTRKDDYFRCGLSVSRPIHLVRWIDTSVSLFYDYSENQSNDFQGAYDRHFTGLRLTGSL